MKTARRIFLGFFEILLSKFLKDSRIRRGCLEDCTNNKDILRFQFDDLSRNVRGFNEDITNFEVLNYRSFFEDPRIHPRFSED